MRSLLYTIFSCLFFSFTVPALAQQGNWPKLITTGSGSEIKIFEIQPQSLNGNKLELQAAISVKENASSEPVFGMIWGDAIIEKDQLNVTRFSSVNIDKLKVPGVTAINDVDELKSIIENELTRFSLNIAISQLLADIESNQRQAKLAGNINNNPPKVIFAKTSSILVFIDGEPQIQKNATWGVDQVVNTPFTIIKNNDDRFYLYGNKKWFSSPTIHGNWSYITQLPQHLITVDQEVRKSDTSVVLDNTIPNVIVTTVPAELIQSKGEPNFAPVQGTNLLYMTNTTNDIFHDINSQRYYVLISGRWYKAPTLNSNWTYTASNELPEEFAKIPEGSAKDAVLASIAGTAAAEESVLDAQIPQTARVDRSTATANVDYDGEPQFEQIEGTDMEYAVNTPGAVIHSDRKYYYVENGVWFESNNANGPWVVATERPDEVANIPPSSPVYNVKYVYIYDATPEYVYMGYTPGYLGTYVYGRTIVYGTGYHYRPWRGRYYYARPLTWGFNMRYNPWSGWNIGFGFGTGWFYSEVGSYSYYGQRARNNYYPCYGWWGPTTYRPQYGRRYGNYYGGNVIINNNYIVSNNRHNNVYRSRRDVVTSDRTRYEGSRYSTAGIDLRNSNRSRNYPNNNGTRFNGRNQQGAVNNSNNRNTDRPGRFSGVSRRDNDNNNNVGVNNGSTPSNRLPAERSGRIVRPQNDQQANRGENNNSQQNNRERFGSIRPGTVDNGNRRNSETNNPPVTTVPEASTPVRTPGNNFPSNPQVNREQTENKPGITYERPAQPEANRSQPSRNPEVNREVSRPEVNREVSRPEVNREVSRPEVIRQPDQPVRVYAPQRNQEPERNNNPAPQREPEVRRPAPETRPATPEINRGSNGGVDRTPERPNQQRSDNNQSGEIKRPGRIGNLR